MKVNVVLLAQHLTGVPVEQWQMVPDGKSYSAEMETRGGDSLRAEIYEGRFIMDVSMADGTYCDFDCSIVLPWLKNYMLEDGKETYGV